MTGRKEGKKQKDLLNKEHERRVITKRVRQQRRR